MNEIEVRVVIGNLLVLLAAYLLGSVPSALLVSRLAASKDIRGSSEGAWSAHSVFCMLRGGEGIVMAATDFGKGAMAVWLARTFGQAVEWQLAAGACALLGHEFPPVPQFRGGLTLAVLLGVLFVFMPAEIMGGLVIGYVVALFEAIGQRKWSDRSRRRGQRSEAFAPGQKKEAQPRQKTGR